MKIRNLALFLSILPVVVTTLALARDAAQNAPAQTPAAEQGQYTPKFPGDPARSDSEAGALGYMRVVVRAQKLYNKKHDSYATSLADLVNTGIQSRSAWQRPRSEAITRLVQRQERWIRPDHDAEESGCPASLVLRG